MESAGVEPLSEAECATASPRAWQAAVDTEQDMMESSRMSSLRT
jgi:hypothetical protein